MSDGPVSGGSSTSVAEAGDTPGSRSEALITYRYLRCGIIAAVVMLAASVLYERTQAPGCWQTSISAYYYTPVRAIFVGALMIIGFSLIVIRGRSNVEDLFLNLAGMFAPVVALVPTSGAGNCFSIRQSPDPTVMRNGEKVLADWVHYNVRNNMLALFAAGILAVILIIAIRDRQRPRVTTADATGRLTVSLLVVIALLVVGMVAYLVWPAFEVRSHYIAAMVMFLFLGVVVFHHERACPAPAYKRLYRGTWVAMAASLAVAFLQFRHSILVLEVLEIGLFSAFWIVETKEEWAHIRVR